MLPKPLCKSPNSPHSISKIKQNAHSKNKIKIKMQAQKHTVGSKNTKERTHNRGKQTKNNVSIRMMRIQAKSVGSWNLLGSIPEAEATKKKCTDDALPTRLDVYIKNHQNLLHFSNSRTGKGTQISKPWLSRL